MIKLITTKKLVYLTVFLTPLYLIKFEILSFPLNILEILIAATFLSFILESEKLNLLGFFRKYKIYIILTSFILLGLATSLLSGKNYLEGIGIIKGWFIVPLIFSFVILNKISNKEDVKKLLKTLYLSVFFVALIGIFYLISGKLTYDNRLSAFYLSPNHLAMFLSPGVFLGFWQITSHLNNNDLRRKNLKILVSSLSLLIILIALYFTYSYAAWISVIISFGFLALLGLKRKIFPKIAYFLLMMIFLIFLILIQHNNPKFQDMKNLSERSSLSSRIMIWKSSFRIITDNPVFGIGPGNFQNKYLEYQKYFPPYLEWAVPQPHNLYIAFWLQGGLLGITSFLYLVFRWIKQSVSSLTNKKSDTFQIVALLAGIMIYILLHGLTDTPYWKNDLSVIFWTVFSLGLLAAEKGDLE